VLPLAAAAQQIGPSAIESWKLMWDEFGVILDQTGGYWREGCFVLVALEVKLCLLLHFVCRLLV
jgi:hypothetical protein